MRLLFFYPLLLAACLILQTSVLAERFCGTTTDGFLYDPETLDPLQIGNANMLKSFMRKAWPVVESAMGSIQPIKYCFANKEASDTLKCDIGNAMTDWSKALGPPRPAEAEPVGHSVFFKQARLPFEDGKSVISYCFDDGTDKGGTPSAAIGYISSGSPGRNRMILPEAPGREKVAHEIAHVLGMIHEQCRDDRDEYVEYLCKNVAGYDAAFGRAVASDDPEAGEKLCYDKQFAERHGFDGSQFTKNHDFWDQFGMFDYGTFDLGSIMLYPSNAFFTSKCWSSNMDACPMVGIDKLNGKVTGTSWIHGNAQPSAGDIAFVKKWYPYRDLVRAVP
ncbi:hypothetical protein CC86DRAFT_386491 [Ophiobolus disseminans]|uniref:Metalloendopeptidase n=1 Tax=Ophiobolus disseminans TaxID=1469910 RepID=A0A6A6ZKG5_9PLEO|nr:hypothetical protein CC86DRAFT_386491 [Ophiobolus disseminans]